MMIYMVFLSRLMYESMIEYMTYLNIRLVRICGKTYIFRRYLICLSLVTCLIWIDLLLLLFFSKLWIDLLACSYKSLYSFGHFG